MAPAARCRGHGRYIHLARRDTVTSGSAASDQVLVADGMAVTDIVDEHGARPTGGRVVAVAEAQVYGPDIGQIHTGKIRSAGW